MGVSETLKDAVSRKDVVAIRDSLWSRIALDPNFTKGFPESLKYCLDNGITEACLYEQHDSRPMSDEVTNENFNALCGELSTNFSKERLEKIKEIGRKLYPATEEKIHSQTSDTQNNGYRRSNKAPSSNQKDGDSGLLPKLCLWVALGAISGGLIGGLLFKKAIIGTIAGAALGVAGATCTRK